MLFREEEAGLCEEDMLAASEVSVKFESVQEYAKGTAVPIEFTSFRKYSEALTRMYGDPDIVKSKTREINALCQISFVSVYISEFHRFQVYIT